MFEIFENYKIVCIRVVKWFTKFQIFICLTQLLNLMNGLDYKSKTMVITILLHFHFHQYYFRFLKWIIFVDSLVPPWKFFILSSSLIFILLLLSLFALYIYVIIYWDKSLTSTIAKHLWSLWCNFHFRKRRWKWSRAVFVTDS